MQVALFQDRRSNRGEVELAIRARDRDELRAAGEEFRPATLVRLDVGVFMAENAVIGAAELCERETVGRGAVEDEKNFAVGLEDFAHQLGDAARPLILTVGRRGRGVRLLERGPGLRRDPGCVVAREIVTVRCHDAL